MYDHFYHWQMEAFKKIFILSKDLKLPSSEIVEPIWITFCKALFMKLLWKNCPYFMKLKQWWGMFSQIFRKLVITWHKA